MLTSKNHTCRIRIERWAQPRAATIWYSVGSIRKSIKCQIGSVVVQLAMIIEAYKLVGPRVPERTVVHKAWVSALLMWEIRAVRLKCEDNNELIDEQLWMETIDEVDGWPNENGRCHMFSAKTWNGPRTLNDISVTLFMLSHVASFLSTNTTKN